MGKKESEAPIASVPWYDIAAVVKAEVVQDDNDDDEDEPEPELEAQQEAGKPEQSPSLLGVREGQTGNIEFNSTKFSRAMTSEQFVDALLAIASHLYPVGDWLFRLRTRVQELFLEP